ncbi:UTP--glucose-1-phosphate uridylyltransferase [Actinomycetospora cinnamomea]|uniref:UTP--glucose-1-phosphate uridylyltransferase n=1 Tax=Actinomycetospora cinnamomea TaxID=663609 RepID=A0A2U1FSE3_9PSEU|nr:UTP--glucose-1-phosphate uridylyltransferase [Actinomycetospora cinnamomea]PVZ14970.1 UTP--glucose-1-phosphate uridylyltransferase [Actinomycetospora cinnamomea]
MSYVDAALAALTERDPHPAEVEAFRRRLEQLAEPDSAVLPGDALEPVTDLPTLDTLDEPSDAAARDALDRLAVIKLNGGLGTSMGLDGPKSLLEIKPGTSFLDAVARQTLALRERHGARLPLLLMDSEGTRGPSLAALRRHAGLEDPDLPLDFLQGTEPKLRADDWHPVEWPADPRLEWCPPGHGDIYTALTASGALERLLAAGVRWAFVSNSDNLGAVPDVRVAAWLAAQEVPFCLEVARRTPMDRKGGHLASRDGSLVLRETAQVPEGDDSFTDIERFCFFNTNNLWIDLEHLRAMQSDDPAAPYLPLIVNRKTVDPTDKSSTPVLQLETAMGAAIGSIRGARALEVPRARFAPVKTTDDLLVARSDLYDLTDDGRMVPTWSGEAPVVALDKETFAMLGDFERRFAGGAPSLAKASALTVTGDVTFGADVAVEGSVTVEGPRHVEDGEVLAG